MARTVLRLRFFVSFFLIDNIHREQINKKFSYSTNGEKTSQSALARTDNLSQINIVKSVVWEGDGKKERVGFGGKGDKTVFWKMF